MTLTRVRFSVFLILLGTYQIQGSFWGRERPETIWDAIEQNNIGACYYHIEKSSRKSLESMGPSGETPLHSAAKKGLIKICRELIFRNVSPHSENKYGQTPLHVAAIYGHVNIWNFLVDMGAGVTHLDKDGTAPIHLLGEMPGGVAPSYLPISLVPGNYDLTNKSGLTALHIAVMRENLAGAKLLINANVSLDIPDNDGYSPIFYAAKQRVPSFIFLLTKYRKNSDVQISDKCGWTLLHVACHGGFINDSYSDSTGSVREVEQALKFLLEKGVLINAQDMNGRTPLHVAVQDGCEWACRFLIKNGADPLCKNTDGISPLIYTTQNRKWNLVTILSEGVNSVIAVGSDNRTVLHEACYSMSKKSLFVELLNKTKQLIHIQDNEGLTPLHSASMLGKDIFCSELLKKGALKKALDKQKRTPLHIASMHGSVKVCEELLNYFRSKSDVQNAPEKSYSLFSFLDRRMQLEECVKPVGDTKGDEATSSTSLFEVGHTSYASKKGSKEENRTLNAQDYNGKTALHYASERGNALICSLLISCGADTQSLDSRKRVPLHSCFFAEDRKNVCQLLAQASGDSINARDQDDWTPLHYASFYGTADECEHLLAHGADVHSTSSASPPLLLCYLRDFKNKENDRDLWSKLVRQHIDATLTRDKPRREAIARLLLKKGANPNARDEEGHCVLHIVSAGNLLSDLLHTITQYKPNYDVQDNDGMTPLHYAVSANVYADTVDSHFSMCEELIKLGADTHRVTSDGDTMVHLMCQKEGLYDIFKIIAWKRDDYNAQNCRGSTPLHHAAYYGQETHAKKLIALGAECDKEDDQGQTPLHRAVMGGCTAMCTFLLESGANAKKECKSGFTPLSLAVQLGNVTLCTLFSEREGAPIHEKDLIGRTPLHFAVVAKNLEICTLLLDRSAQVNSQDDEGLTPLMYACRWPHKEIFTFLLEQKDLECERKDSLIGGTALHWACARDQYDFCKSLLEKGFNPDRKSDDTSSLLHKACIKDNVPLIKLFLQNKADPNILNRDGETPLHVAVKKRSIEALKFLLVNQYTFNVKINEVSTTTKKSALHLAVGYDSVNAVELLLTYEAIPHTQDGYGKTPIEYAVEQNRPAMCTLLKKKIAVTEFNAIKKRLRTIAGRDRLLSRIVSDYDYVPRLSNLSDYESIPQSTNITEVTTTHAIDTSEELYQPLKAKYEEKIYTNEDEPVAVDGDIETQSLTGSELGADTSTNEFLESITIEELARE